jgi:hypothetical protein
MNRPQAKEILALYRPETADAEDPSFAEALELCRRDSELERWFEEHCALHTALRARFRQIPVPQGLKEQILAERKARLTPLRRRSLILAGVAAAAVLTGLVSLWLPTREEPGFEMYQEQMTSLALCDYAMDLTTNSPVQVRAYLAQRGAPADYVVPGLLQQATLTGCAIESWQGARVSMVCYRSGKALPPGQSSDLWLFVIDRASVRGGPAAPSPTITRVNRAVTASWSEAGRTYLLVADGDEAFIRRFL